MSWIKRNLYFLIGSTVAVALLGLAGYYFYSQWQRNNESLDRLNSAYQELDNLAKEKPNPGNDKVNNIEIAREQEARVRAIIDRERKYFMPIAPVPNTTNDVVSKEEFASALRRTIDEMTRDAAAASVTLPKDYGFTFDAERRLTLFAPGSLQPLSQKLGEIREICRVLYRAKINSLDNLRRERVSGDDAKGSSADFVELLSVTNQLAVLTPYEVVFQCFTPELAGVLAGFASSPHGFIVKAINVETRSAQASASAELPEGPFRPPPTATPSAAPASKGALPLLVDEKPLRVTLVLSLVKQRAKR